MNPVTNVAGFAHQAGSAARIDFAPPAGAAGVRVLRRVGTNPTGPTDAAAAMVLDGPPSQVVDDTQSYVVDVDLANGTDYRYALYAFDENRVYSAPALVAVTPALASVFDESDSKAVLMARVERTMADLIAGGGFTFRSGVDVKVYSAYPLLDTAKFPCVSVHRDGDADGDRFIGDLAGEHVDESGHWTDHGRYSTQRFTVIGWAHDPDERDVLYRLIKAALRLNLHLFHEAGLENVTASGSDAEDFITFDVPMFYAVFEVSCEVRGIARRGVTQKITSVEVSPAIGAPNGEGLAYQQPGVA